MDELKAFAITPHMAAVARNPQSKADEPQLTIMSTGMASVMVYGEQSLRTLVAACRHALGELPASPHEGKW